MTRAVRRDDFPGNDGRWRASVEERLRRLFSVAGTGPHEPSGVVTLTELVNDPTGPQQFVNTDTAIAVGPVPTGDLPIVLSRVPKAGSEQVFIAGLPIPRSAWTRTDHELTIPGQPWFWTGMPAWVDYAYDGTSDRVGPIIHSPGATTDTTPTISGTGAGGRSLQVWVDGVSVGTTTITAAGTWTVTVASPLALGAHTVTARQTEPDGSVLDATPATVFIVTVPLTSLTLRGVDETGELPAATHVGDFIVVATWDQSYAGDSRLTKISTNPPAHLQVYIGNATTLAPLVHSGSGPAKVVTFVGSAIKLASSYAHQPDSSGSPTAPSVPGSAAVLAVGEASTWVSGTWAPPTPWVRAPAGASPPYSDGGVHSGTVDIFYWSDASATDTPAGAMNSGGGVDESDAFVVSLQAP